MYVARLLQPSIEISRYTHQLAHRFQPLRRDAREGFLRPFDTGDSLLRSVSLRRNVVDPLLNSRMTYYQSFAHNAVRFGTHCLFQNHNILRALTPLPCMRTGYQNSLTRDTHTRPGGTRESRARRRRTYRCHVPRTPVRFRTMEILI